MHSMKKPSFQFWKIGLILLLLPLATQAGIMREATLDKQTYASTSSPFDSTIIHRASVYAVAAPVLNTNFSTLGETELTFTVKAPLGVRFRISFPENGFLSIGYEDGSRASSSGAARLTPVLTFSGFGGSTLPTSSSNMVLTGPGVGNDIYYAKAEWSLTAGTDFWFESLSIADLIPAGYNANLLGGGTAQADIVGNILTDTPADFGQFVYLEAIPVASSVPIAPTWLMLGAGILLLTRNHRKFQLRVQRP